MKYPVSYPRHFLDFFVEAHILSFGFGPNERKSAAVFRTRCLLN
jgi:hypothetical protein